MFHFRLVIPALFVLLGSAQLVSAQIVAAVATIDEIDAKKGLIAVKNDTARGVLKITDKSTVLKNGKKATIDDLQIGETVQVAYNRKTGEVSRLTVTNAPVKFQRDTFVTIQARVAEVDAKNNTITVNHRVNGAEVTLKVVPKSKILDDGLKVKLDDIKKGQRVTVRFLKKQKLIQVMYLVDSFE